MNKYLLALFSMCFLFIVACEPDEAEDENDEEVITDMTYTLTSGSETVVLSFSDPDGEGGAAPVVTGGTLSANTSYSGSIELLNASDPDDIEDITEEVAEEDDEHQFFFDSSIAGLSVAYGDSDDDGNPLGLNTTLTTGAAGQGTLTVILRHEPNKTAAGVPDGDIANAGGETDIEVTWNVNVQ